MSYAGFEGLIPKGEYGGGTVMLWDRGEWEAVGGKDPAKTIDEGHVHVILHGERMKGEWLLVRMKPRPGEKRENWLLRKVEDRFAGASGELVDTGLTSVSSGRTMAEIADGDDPVWHSDAAKAKADPKAANAPSRKPAKSKRAARRSGKPPKFVAPQLATLVDHVPTGAGWLHEVKYDGYRVLLAVGGGRAVAYTRSGLDWSDRFQVIVDAASGLGGPSLIDGEVVALDDEGRPSFSRLQHALKHGGDLKYFAFDLIEAEGEDLTPLGNADRKARLAALLDGAPSPIHLAEHVESGGEKLFSALCRGGYEGVVSKRADAPYRGTRTRNWLKIKCTRRQEFVILGYVESDKKGRGLRSLVLGLNEGGALRHVGRVGTGFDSDTRDMLLARLAPLRRKTPPVDVPASVARGVVWVTPRLVAEVAFAEMTADAMVRHASFIGLREDKPPEDVVPEVAAKVANSHSAPFGVVISHPDRVIFSADGRTKGDLAAYYAAMADPMLRWLGDRPVSLVRCPQGRGRQCFFQKHDSGAFGDTVDHVAIREKDGGTADYLVINTGEALLTCVQMGTIEFHGWGAPARDVEHPDRLVFDLDPEEGLDFGEVRSGALQIRDLLGEMGLATFPMATGGKGIHIIAPLDGSADWPQVKDFASRFARAMAEAHPKRFTANMRKAERKGRIFIDWLRNERGATAVMPYSVRSREVAAVASPINWSELAALKDARPYTIDDADRLLARVAGRELKGWCEATQALPPL
jgi:bifunctional non-homologous end joining protein LigD